MLLTRAPLYLLPEGNFRVRLACLRHAASVDSEPGSNSRYKFVLWNIIYYWFFRSVSIMTLASFRRELYRSRLTLKGLETDTLYLVFKDRIPKLYLDCLTDDSNSPQANGDINQRPRVCQASLSFYLFGRFPVKRKGHYRDKTRIVNTFNSSA